MANFLDCIFRHCGPTTVRPQPDWHLRLTGLTVLLTKKTVTTSGLVGLLLLDARRVHAGGFSFGRRPTLPSETLRIPNRPRTAVTVRLSLSDMAVMVFPASTISRSWLSSSGSHGRLPYFMGRIHLTGGAKGAPQCGRRLAG